MYVIFLTPNLYSDKMPTIKLQSSDGDIFPVDVEIAKQSVTIKTMLEVTSEDKTCLPIAQLFENQTVMPICQRQLRSGKMLLRPDPELPLNQIPKHMPVFGAPVEADASAKTD